MLQKVNIKLKSLFSTTRTSSLFCFCVLRDCNNLISDFVLYSASWIPSSLKTLHNLWMELQQGPGNMACCIRKSGTTNLFENWLCVQCCLTWWSGWQVWMEAMRMRKWAAQNTCALLSRNVLLGAILNKYHPHVIHMWQQTGAVYDVRSSMELIRCLLNWIELFRGFFSLLLPLLPPPPPPFPSSSSSSSIIQ